MDVSVVKCILLHCSFAGHLCLLVSYVLKAHCCHLLNNRKMYHSQWNQELSLPGTFAPWNIRSQER